jgi:hypothetical protein
MSSQYTGDPDARCYGECKRNGIHLSQGGTDIRTLQELLGHTDVKTTEIYAHAAKIGNDKGVRSPLDAMGAFSPNQQNNQQSTINNRKSSIVNRCVVEG